MRKLFRSIPRPVKTLFYMIGISLATFLLYIFIGAPPLSEEHAYRRAERANLVGPAKILDIIDLAPVVDEHYSRMIIANDGDAVILYMWDAQHNLSEKLVYRQKQGAVTVFAAPYELFLYSTDHEFKIPIILFDDFPQAVRAEMEFTLWTIQDSEAIPQVCLPKDYFGEAYRKNDGYFCFYIYSPDFSWIQWTNDSEEPTLSTFCKLTGKTFSRMDTDTTLPVTVRLFDADNQLMHEETVIIRSIIGEAHYERGELP